MRQCPSSESKWVRGFNAGVYNVVVLFCFDSVPREYIDLTRNQNLLRLLVSRRGLPITDSIPSGLQRIKAILSGLEERNLPSNIASRLM